MISPVETPSLGSRRSRPVAVAALNWLALLSLVSSGCTGNLTSFIGQSLGHLGDTQFRAVVLVSPSRLAPRSGSDSPTDWAASKRAGEACTLYAHLVRSQPGYSARALSREFAACVLGHGAAQVTCEFTIGHVGAAPDDTAVEIPVSYRVTSTNGATPASSASWVAEAAWRAIPKEGQFTIRVPARAQPGSGWQFALRKAQESDGQAGKWSTAAEAFSQPALRSLVVAEASASLAADIEPQLRRMLDDDGFTRFKERKVAYGYGLCELEAAPHEDGIDALVVLYVAQHLQDGDFLPPYLETADQATREEIIDLARKVCASMQPRRWRSTQRERLDARPAFISKATIVLELPPGTQQVSVSRNAFTDEGRELLGRMERLMTEFVAKLNARALRASGVDPAEVEARWRKIMPDASRP